MGLDTAEIVMKVEKTFDIKIPDKELECATTVSDLHRVVWSHMPDRRTSKCASQMLFYKLRSYITLEFGLSASAVAPQIAPESILPRKNRKQLYSKFSSAVDLTMPALELPKSGGIFLALFGLISVVCTFLIVLFMTVFRDYSIKLFIWPISGAFVTYMLSRFMEPLRTVIATPTFRSFIEAVLMLNYGKLSAETPFMRQEVEGIINNILAEHSGLERAKITKEKRIGEDLGID